MMVERVLIVRLGSMGDVLHAVPAVAALRASVPDAYIGWAVERRWTPLLVAEGKEESPSGCPGLIAPDVGAIRWGSSRGSRSPQRPLVDRVHVVDTRGWRKAAFSDATWSDVRHTFRDLRAEHYDLAIDFQGSIKSAVVAHFSGATSSIGFAQPREKPATMFYTSVVQPTGRHIVDQNLDLLSSVFPLRTSASSALKVFPIDTAAESEVDRKLATLVPRSSSLFAILNPGAGWPAKQWPASRYGEIARALRDDGLVSLVNYGPGEESLAREVEASSDGSARPISCTLSELIALTRRASLFIGGDTGPMHLAAALGIPVVALFGPTDPARNGPYSGATSGWPTLARVARVGHPESITLRHPDSRITTAHSSAPDPGLVQITSEEVTNAARKLLTREPKAESREPLS